ncbi:MAG: hypothetical protein AAF317_02180 [Pseudomonadota bacterium]
MNDLPRPSIGDRHDRTRNNGINEYLLRAPGPRAVFDLIRQAQERNK